MEFSAMYVIVLFLLDRLTLSRNTHSEFNGTPTAKVVNSSFTATRRY